MFELSVDGVTSLVDNKTHIENGASNCVRYGSMLAKDVNCVEYGSMIAKDVNS